jgi:alkylated DNA repair dioxygenase AlkB
MTTLNGILGLIVIPNYISQIQHDWLVQKIDSLPWSDVLKRRTQHYGWQYRYDRSLLTHDRDYLGELPNWLIRLSSYLKEWLPICNQVIINDYQKDQKIGKHIDHIHNFGNKIVTLSLCNSGILVFRKADQKFEVILNPCDLLIMFDQFRYEWTHELKPVTERRISITFRQVIV